MVGGEEQVAGARIQVSESEVRSEHDEHLLPAFCLLLSGLRFLPSAYCRLPTAFGERRRGPRTRPPEASPQATSSA